MKQHRKHFNEASVFESLLPFILNIMKNFIALSFYSAWKFGMISFNFNGV